MFDRRAAGARSRGRSWALVLVGGTVLFSGRARATEPSAGPAQDDATAQTLAVERARLAALAGKAEQVGPLIALEQLEDLLPPGALDADFRGVVDGGKANPLVVARAREWLARRAEATGDERGAEELRRPLGLLSTLWVVGPFGDGRASHGVVFPPEQEEAKARGAPDQARGYPGKEREVSWRSVDGGVYGGRVHLDALLRPDSDAAAYLLAFVRVPSGTDAALRLGTPGPVKVWSNGTLVHAVDRARAARFDQDAVGVRLRPGWNRILIKTVVTQGSWQLYARLTRPDGEPLAFENALAPAGDVTPTASRAAVRVDDLEGALRAAAKRAGPADARARAWLDLGRYLLAVDPADHDVHAAAQAFEASAGARPSVPALLGLAASARDDDERRRALERALPVCATAGERARVLAALGDVARDQHRESAAIDHWRAALDASPGFWPASLALASQEQTAGLPGAALARIDGLPPGARALPAVLRARARLLVALERSREAAQVLEGLLASARDDVEVWRELASFAWDRGDPAEASRALGRAAALRPDLPSLTVDWARQREADGDLAGARATLEHAAARMPDEFAFAAELGKLLDRHGGLADALPWLRKGLALRPQDVELRRYADAAEGRARLAADQRGGGTHGARDDLAKAFAASVPDLIAAEARRAGSRAVVDAEADPAVVLLDRRVVRVHPNGLAETFSQRVTAVRTDAGAQDNKEFYVRYTPGSEEVDVREARIYRPDGHGGWEVLQSTGRDDEDLSEPWYGLYYDFRAEVVRFEGLRAGDVVDVEYVVSDVSRENQLAGYFGDLEFVGESLPKRRWDYTLLGPRDRPFYFARPVLARLTESTAEENGEKVYRFAATDIPRLEAEPAMPGLGETSPYLHVSTYRSWEEVGAWYWHLIEEQLVPDDNIRRAAAAALKQPGRAPLTDLEKVRALHALVVGGTRYVGLEFGIHGFKPYKVSQVLSRRFGDCKDKAALLVVLLRQAGIDAEMVLLRTRRGGQLAPLPASLAIFDHAIVFVPKLNLYLDGTAEFSGMDELPGQDQGVMVLRVGPRGSHLDQTPVLPAARNRAVRRWDVALSADGSADVHEKLTLTGQAAPEWREHYQTKGERPDRYGKALSARNPGAQLLSVDMPGIEDRNRPVTVLSHATIPALAEQTPDKALRLTLGTHEVDLARTYARLSERKSPLVLGYPWQHDEQIVYQFPPHFAVTHLPASRRIESPFGHFDLQVRQQGAATGPATVVVTGDLDVERDRVTPAEYPAFRRFLAEVDSAMAERITAAPRRMEAPGPRPATAAAGRAAEP
jgi:tetratricopeptide (TPR) repeat protein